VTRIISMHELPFGTFAHRFEGRRYGGVDVSFFVVSCKEREHAQYSHLRRTWRGADRRTGVGMSSRPTRACVGLSELLPKRPDPFPDRRARHGELLDTPNRPEHVPSPPGSPTGLAEKGWKSSRRGRVALRQGCPGGSGDRGAQPGHVVSKCNGFARYGSLLRDIGRLMRDRREFRAHGGFLFT
jgi:hypothetical protein